MVCEAVIVITFIRCVIFFCKYCIAILHGYTVRSCYQFWAISLLIPLREVSVAQVWNHSLFRNDNFILGSSHDVYHIGILIDLIQTWYVELGLTFGHSPLLVHFVELLTHFPIRIQFRNRYDFGITGLTHIWHILYIYLLNLRYSLCLKPGRHWFLILLFLLFGFVCKCFVLIVGAMKLKCCVNVELIVVDNWSFGCFLGTRKWNQLSNVG